MEPSDITRQKRHLREREAMDRVAPQAEAARADERAELQGIIQDSYVTADEVSDFIHEEAGVSETTARNLTTASNARTRRGDVIDHRSRITRIRDRGNFHEKGSTTRNESFVGIESFTTSTSNMMPLGEVDPDATDGHTHAFVEFYVEEENIPELTTGVVFDKPKQKKTKLDRGHATKVGYRLYTGPENALEEIEGTEPEERTTARNRLLKRVDDPGEEGTDSEITLPAIRHSKNGRPIGDRLSSALQGATHLGLIHMYAPETLTAGPPRRVVVHAEDAAGNKLYDQNHQPVTQAQTLPPDADEMTLFLNGYTRSENLAEKLSQEAQQGTITTPGLQEKIDRDRNTIDEIRELLEMARDYAEEQRRIEEEQRLEEERQRELERIRQELARQAEEDAAQNPIPRGPDPGTPHSPPWA